MPDPGTCSFIGTQACAGPVGTGDLAETILVAGTNPSVGSANWVATGTYHAEHEFKLDTGLVPLGTFSKVSSGSVTVSVSGASHTMSRSPGTGAHETVTGTYTGPIDRAE